MINLTCKHCLRYDISCNKTCLDHGVLIVYVNWLT